MKKIISSLFIKPIITTACCRATIVIISCPTPINEKIFLKVKDEIAPQFTVTSPMDGDANGAYTLVTGVVSDLSNEGAEGSVSSLFFEILGITGNQSIPINKDGSFSTILTTNGAGYSGDIILKLVALDWNGNSKEITLALKKAEGEVVGFSVTAGNKSALIEWDTLPGALSYSVQEIYTVTIKDSITAHPYTWEGLSNGSLYAFRVLSEMTEESYTSSFIDAIPLAATTLAPNTESVYRGINLSWKDIPAASKYVIEGQQQWKALVQY